MRQFFPTDVRAGRCPYIASTYCNKGDEGIASLWQALEHYWHHTWQRNLSRKQAVEQARDKLITSDGLEHFIEALSLESMT
ncbi:hypothetical protein DK37_19710 [Halomonas sp. SUBG004]|nr:hypothetical protein DK37_19710 [Halomonas sp. SUBG004]